MKVWAKIMVWAGAAGIVGFFGGEQVQKKQIRKLVEDLNRLREENALLNVIVNADGAPNPKPEKNGADIRGKGEPYKSLDEYAGHDIPEKPGEPAPDVPPMVAEVPVIGDEDTVEIPQAIEFITEEEYYNERGMPQEQLIWYTLDEVLFNKDTNSILTKDEIHRSIGYGTLEIFDHEENTESIFVRNNLLDPPTLFRIDRLEAARCDEHGDTYDEDV